MKNYTRIILLCIIFSAIGVFAAKPGNNQTHSPNAAHNNGPANSLNSFTAFYTEDFGGGIPAGWLTIDSAGNGLNWKYTTTGSNGGATLSATGTSAANGYMIIDSDSAGTSLGGENAELISGAIDCSGRTTVVLNFNEYLTHYNDTATVWISTDSTTWTEVHNTSAPLSVFSSTPNPNNVDIDITALAANQPTVYIRFNYRADYSYYWMIDDVQLYELPGTDAALTEIAAPTTSCTLLGATETVTVNIFNAGGTDINGGISVTMVLDNGTPVTENINDTITVGSDLLYSFTATGDLSQPGSHTLMVYIALAGDTNAINDTITSHIFNGPHVVNYTSSYTNGFEPSDDLSGWVIEDVNNDSVSWTISPTFPHTGINSAKINGLVADDWYITTCLDLDSTIAYKLTYYSKTSSTSTQALFDIFIGDIQSAGGMNQEIKPASYVTNVIYAQETVIFTPFSSGTYYIGFHVATADSIVGFWLDDINLTTDSSGVGVKNIPASDVSVFPNPSSGQVFINSRETSAGGFTVEVYSPIGQLITRHATANLNNYRVDLQDLQSGVYVVRIISDKGISSRQISLTH
jgi:hypothetical protein